MSVFANVAFPLQMRNVPRHQIEQSVREALDLVRLDGLDARRPHQLSGGQQQRVALARALVFRPGLLLLDEPLGPLDLKLRQELQSEIKRIHERLRTTVLFVTHDQSEALSMSDRVVLMKEGMVHQVGTPQQLYRSPATVFVARFIGESNLVTGKLVAQEGRHVVLENDDGLTFRGVANTVVGSNQLTLLVRPESIVPGNHGSLPNSFEGRIEEVVYLGEITQYQIRVGASTSLVVHWQNRSGLPQLRRDDPVILGWLEEDMIAVSDT
jgi:ABC-type Fe3+/spermidine/putrescine transport system ATPase subunit